MRTKTEERTVFKIIEKQEIAPNVHELVIEAPQIARKAKAGQFVILMADETSERIPFTISGWDRQAGTITLIVLEMGQSSRKLVMKEAGDAVAHLAGPLGVPLEIERYGTVALAAGCYGIGAIVCIAEALKEAGNRVITVIEARSHYLHYYKKKLEASADQLIQTTIDGSEGVKGHSLDVIGRKLKEGEKLDRVIAVGCLNPIMVDGTGMCGACRVSVANETKFACVDGPFFDAHQVDWDELFARKAAYSAEEINSLERTEPHRHG
jgi:NAD(P)H-flavin reductase